MFIMGQLNSSIDYMYMDEIILLGLLILTEMMI